MAEVPFSDWEKLNLIVAQIKKVEDIPGADKLYKITLDIGKPEERVICAGIKPYYEKKELKNKKIIFFENLAPKKIKEIESQGMLLAACTKNHEKVILISPEKDIEVGSKIS